MTGETERQNQEVSVRKRYPLLLPSIGDMLFMTVFLYLAFYEGKGLLADCDTGYHIRAGEFILNTLSVPSYDMFSYKVPPLPWTAHEWLSEIIMALIHKAFGLTGLVIFFSFLIASIYSLLFRIVRTYGSNILAASAVVILAIASSQIHWLARPHVFSLLLMVLWYFLLESYQYRNRNYLYLLPLIMLLWVNLHGGFMAGFMLIGIFFAGNLWTFIFSGEADRENSREKCKMLGYTIAASLIVSLINPFFYKILLFPFKLTSSKYIMDNVVEFISPNFHEPMVFTALFLFVIAVLAISKKSLNIIETVLLLLFSYMALYSARYIPLYSIIVAPVLIRQLDYLLYHSSGRVALFIKQRAENISRTDASAKGYIWPAVSVLMVILLAANGGIRFNFDDQIKPVAAVEFLKKERISGNMFNSDQFGSYIIYSTWPQYKVFIDGRLDMYGEEDIREYFKVTRIEPGWEDVIQKYNIRWIIFDAKTSLSSFLCERKEWKLIYADKVANIFVRDIPEYQHLTSKYKEIRPFVEVKK
jgi:hypothetical protein